MHPTLATRRRLVRLRRLVALVTLAVAAFIPIHLAMTLIPSSTVVVAREDLAAGRVLTTRDVDVRRIPPSGVLPGMSSMAANVVGRVLLVDVGRGEALSRGVLADAPRVPSGYAALEIPIVGTGAGIAPGDEVMLLSVGECAKDERHEELCPVSDGALVLDGVRRRQGTAILSLALPAEDAIRVTRISDATPMVAVSASAR